MSGDRRDLYRADLDAERQRLRELARERTVTEERLADLKARIAVLHAGGEDA
jgi:hypothetical protein